jgi:hypothetical protein
MKLNGLFTILAGMLLAVGLTACEGEKDLKIIEGDLPIKTSTLYMVGDATPNGWDIGNPTPLQVTGDDALVFSWEGELRTGEIKLCLTTGSWDAPFIRPTVNGTEISRNNISDAQFAMHAGDPDDKWRVAEAGKYRLMFNLRQWTMSTEYLGEPDAPVIEPIEAEAVYIVGDAAPNGWNIDAPSQMEKVSQYVFKYEGALTAGELKACTQTGDWNAPFIRPTFGGCKINKSGIESEDFVFTTGPDDKWQVEESGMYRLTLDLEHWKAKVEYLGEIPASDKQPIEAEAVYIVGDATPNGWSIDAPTQLTKVSKYIFKYEGELMTGELKACTQTGDWGVSFIRPTFGGCKISLSGVESNDFVFTTSPDDKWNVTEAGQYRITFDLEHYTIKAEKLTSKQPLETEALYIVGDATPNGWSIDAPTQLKKESQYVFVYEGKLTVGELKACTQTGSWDVSFVRPTFANCKISKSGVENTEFVFTASPDDKWKVEEEGQYRLKFDLKAWTLSVETM